jgi:hypothetical protein
MLHDKIEYEAVYPIGEFQLTGNLRAPGQCPFGPYTPSPYLSPGLTPGFDCHIWGE